MKKEKERERENRMKDDTCYITFIVFNYNKHFFLIPFLHISPIIQSNLVKHPHVHTYYTKTP